MAQCLLVGTHGRKRPAGFMTASKQTGESLFQCPLQGHTSYGPTSYHEAYRALHFPVAVHAGDQAIGTRAFGGHFQMIHTADTGSRETFTLKGLMV